MPSNTSVPPKVEQVLHVRAKSILSCTFARSAASNRSGVAPPPSYQTVTVNGVTSLLHLNSHDGTVRTVGSVHWDASVVEDDNSKSKAPKRSARISVGEHTTDLSDVLRRNKGVGKDILLKSDTRTIHLPGAEPSTFLQFQRVAMPSGGFPYTVYTIADTSLPPGPTHAHICVGQLTIKRSSKPRASSGSSSIPALLPFFTASRSHPKPEEQNPTAGVVVRLELRTRDKELIDRVVFSSLLIVAGKHPVEADSRVEIDRPVANEWDAPPALSTLVTPALTPQHSSEHLPLASNRNSVPPVYRSEDYARERHLLSNGSQDRVGADPFGIAGPSSLRMDTHSSPGSSIISAA